MQIKLIAPRTSLRPMDSEYKRVLSPSLALLTVAALTPAGHEVRIADENAGTLNLGDAPEGATEGAPDLVGITVNVDTSARAYAIAAGYRERGVPVVLGGIHSCDYVHHQYRTRPIAHVIDEIGRLGTKQVMFIDDNLIGDVGWTLSLLQAIRPLGLKWHAAVSTNVGQYPGLLDEMQATSCQSLFIGFESINQASVASASKRQNHVDAYDGLIRAIHDRGIMVNASLVFGFDHDTPTVFQDTLDWLVRNKIETMTAHQYRAGFRMYEFDSQHIVW